MAGAALIDEDEVSNGDEAPAIGQNQPARRTEDHRPDRLNSGAAGTAVQPDQWRLTRRCIGCREFRDGQLDRCAFGTASVLGHDEIAAADGVIRL